MRSVHMAVVVIMAVVNLTRAAVLAAPSSLQLRITPRFSFEPAVIRITTLIDPHPDNRQACLVWDSVEGMGGASCWEIDGESARTKMRELRGVTAGQYEVALRVARTGGRVLEVTGGFEVVSNR